MNAAIQVLKPFLLFSVCSHQVGLFWSPFKFKFEKLEILLCEPLSTWRNEACTRRSPYLRLLIFLQLFVHSSPDIRSFLWSRKGTVPEKCSLQCSMPQTDCSEMLYAQSVHFQVLKRLSGWWQHRSSWSPWISIVSRMFHQHHRLLSLLIRLQVPFFRCSLSSARSNMLWGQSSHAWWHLAHIKWLWHIYLACALSARLSSSRHQHHLALWHWLIDHLLIGPTISVSFLIRSLDQDRSSYLWCWFLIRSCPKLIWIQSEIFLMSPFLRGQVQYVVRSILTCMVTPGPH